MTESAAAAPKVFPALMKSSGELGLAVTVPKLMYTQVFFKGSYILNAKGGQVPPLGQDKVYFVSFQAGLDRSAEAVAVCAKDNLESLPTISNPGHIFEEAPLIATVDNKFGMVFHDATQVISSVFPYENYFSELPDDIIIPEPGPGQAIFLPFTTMLTPNVVQPFQLVSLKQVTFFVNTNTEDVSANPPVASFTPAVAKQQPKAMDSEGATTVGSASSMSTLTVPSMSYQKNIMSEDRLSTISAASSTPLKRARPPRKSDEIPKPQLPIPPVSSLVSLETSARISKFLDGNGIGMLGIPDEKPIKQIKNMQIPGYDFFMKLNEMRSEGSEIFKEKWNALKHDLKWSTLWGNDGFGNSVYVYAVPFNSKSKSEMLIKNLEYFSRESMELHLLKNPWLTEEWCFLWPRLMEQGWKAIDAKKEKFCVEGMHEDQRVIYAYRPDEKKDELIPGIHLFSSKLAVAQYIARFPFLLQDDTDLTATLIKFGWKKPRSNSFIAPLESRPSLSLKETRNRLWMNPALMFQQYWEECDEERFVTALALPRSEALAKDLEPPSPIIDGLSLAERDKLLVDVHTYSERLLNKNSKKSTANNSANLLIDALSSLGWIYGPASKWSKKWWKHEKVLLAPYARSKIELRKVGLDFFFALEDAAHLFVSERESVLRPVDPKSLSSYFKNHHITNLDDASFDLEKRIGQILINEPNPFEEYLVCSMLEEDGWLIFKKQKTTIFVPKTKRDLKITEDNYRRFSKGEDYLEGEAELVEYYTELVNNTYFKANGDSSNSDESEDEGEDETASDEMDVVEVTSDDESEVEVIEKNAAKKQPKQITTSKKQPVKVAHIADNYADWTPEFKILNDLRLGKRYFGPIYTILRDLLGWRKIYDKQVNGYICASWCIKYGETHNYIIKGKALDMSVFIEGVDYFMDDEGGKETLMKYLETHGFQRSSPFPGDNTTSEQTNMVFGKGFDEAASVGMDVVGVSDDESEVEVLETANKTTTNNKQTAKGTKSTNDQLKQITTSKKQPVKVAHIADNYADWTPEFKILNDLRLGKRYFGPIYTILRDLLGWRKIYDKQVNGYICASWCIKYGETHNYIANAKALDMSVFTKNVDYFIEDVEGKEALFKYLETYGFQRSSPFPNDNATSEQDNYRLSSRSPARALYKAVDPCEHSDRLLTASGSTPQRNFHNSNGIVETPEDYDNEADDHIYASQDFDIGLLNSLQDNLQSMQSSSFSSSPLLSHSPPRNQEYGLKVMKKDKVLVEMLKQTPVREERIVAYVIKNHGWSRIYNRSKINLDVKGCEGEIVFNCGFDEHSSNMVKKRDYFVTHRSVVEYLMVLFGLKEASVETVCSAEKPRVTRSGRVILDEEDDSEDEGSGAEEEEGIEDNEDEDSCAIPKHKYADFVKETKTDGVILRNNGITEKTEWREVLNVLMTLGWVKLNMNGSPCYVKNKGDFEKVSASSVEWEKKECVSFFTSEEQVKEYIRVKLQYEESIVKGVKEKSPQTGMKRSASSQSSYEFSPKRGKLSDNTISFRNTVTSSLGEYIEKAKELLQPSSGRCVAAFPVVNRETESIAILQNIARSLMEGRGSVTYVCGGPGSGKTLSVESAINFLEKMKLRNKYGSDFNVAICNGARTQNMDHILETIQQQTDHMKSKDDIRASLQCPGYPVTFAKNEYLNMEDCYDSTPSSQSSSSDKKDSPKSGKKRNKVMTVLFVNELDMMKPAALQELVRYATNETSSLVLVGTGNIVNALGTPSYDDSILQVIFSPYREEKIHSMLEERAGKVFDNSSKIFLAKKFSKNASDVRKILEAGWEMINKAKNRLTEEDLKGPVKEFVTRSDIPPSLKNALDVLIGKINEQSAQLKSFLVALVLYGFDDLKFNVRQAMDAYTTHAVQRALPTLALDTISSHLQNLQTFGALSQVKSPSKEENYRLQITAENLLQVTGISEIDKGNLRKFAEMRRNINNS